MAAALYNLGPGARVPGRQLAFYCLNYGSLSAMSFAATLPWLDLHQARHVRGWRPGAAACWPPSSGREEAGDSPLRAVEGDPGRARDGRRPAPVWFVIGGQAVRCFAPYRPSRDVDFGVDAPANLEDLVAQLRGQGPVEMQERSPGTVHLLWNGIKVSAFHLPFLAAHVEDRHLTVTGVLATKLHAILDRGLRRDFFDLYVMLQQHHLGIVSALSAIRRVYQAEIDEGLMLRALTYFDDADREAAVPGEGRGDWRVVKDYFLRQVGTLLMPPARRLAVQGGRVGVADE